MARPTPKIKRLTQAAKRTTLEMRSEKDTEHSHRFALAILAARAEAIDPELGKAIEELRQVCNASHNRAFNKRLGIAA